MKKAAIIISIVVAVLAIAFAAVIYFQPSLVSELTFWTQQETTPTEVETEPVETQPPQVTQLSIGGKNKLEKGDSVQLSLTYSPDNADVPKINWSSSDSNVAKVDSTGVISAVAMGECEITAEADGTDVKTSYKITVSDEEMDRINVLNDYLIKIPDSRLESYGTKSTMMLTLEKAEIADFNGDSKPELLVCMTSASGCEFAEIVALDNSDNTYQIKNFTSYADVFEQSYTSYKESLMQSDDGKAILIKTSAVKTDSSKKTKTRTVHITTFNSDGTKLTTLYEDSHQYEDAEFKKYSKSAYEIDGVEYAESNYLSALSNATNGYGELGDSMKARKETLSMGRFVKIETICELDSAYQQQLEWKVDKPEIATVNNSGVVTGVRSGSCVVTATLKGMNSAVARAVINVRESSQALSSYLTDVKGESIKNSDGYTLSYQGAVTADIDNDGAKELLLYYKSGDNIQLDICEDKNGEIERISGAFTDTVSSGNVNLELFVNNANDEIVLCKNNESSSVVVFQFFSYEDNKFEENSSKYKIVTGSTNQYYQDNNTVTQAEFERQTGHYSKYLTFE